MGNLRLTVQQLDDRATTIILEDFSRFTQGTPDTAQRGDADQTC